MGVSFLTQNSVYIIPKNKNLDTGLVELRSEASFGRCCSSLTIYLYYSVAPSKTVTPESVNQNIQRPEIHLFLKAVRTEG